MRGMDRHITFVESIEDAYKVLHEKPVDPSAISNDGRYLKIAGPYFFANPDCIDKKDHIVSCEITFAPEDTELNLTLFLESMRSLQSLFIKDMPITQIRLPQEKTYSSITHFEISGTNIAQLECAEILSIFPRLKSLCIKKNTKLTTITYPVHYWQHLEEIDLRNNGLKTIDLNQLLIVSAHLKYINLSDNPLQSIRWRPDDFVAHHKVPKVMVKNSQLSASDKEFFLKNAADDNRIYLWMKKFVPALFALCFSGGFYNGSGNDLKTTIVMSGVGMPIGYLLGRLLVDTILFPKPKDKRLPYFKPIFE
jgi:hypothetical protein